MAATVQTPAEADRPGRRLAEHGVLASLLPMMVSQQTEELIAAHPDLSPADRATLRATAATTGKAGIAKALYVSVRAYADALAVADLGKLITAAESPEAMRQRAAQPWIIAATMSELQGMDFKKDAIVAFCNQTGKACAVK